MNTLSSCNYQIVTKRDTELLELIEKLRVIDLFVADTMIFTNTKGTRVAQRRLTTLVEYKKLKRWRPNQISPYVYYLGRKPSNIDHAILLSRFVAHLKLLDADILKIKRELLIGEGIRIDLFIAYKLNNKNYISIVECENTKNFNDKYKKLEEYYLNNSYKELFPTMPQIICITDKSFIENEALNVIKIDTEFKRIGKILEA